MIRWWQQLFNPPTPEERARQNERFLQAKLLERNRKFEIFLIEKLAELEKRMPPAPLPEDIEPEDFFSKTLPPQPAAAPAPDEAETPPVFMPRRRLTVIAALPPEATIETEAEPAAQEESDAPPEPPLPLAEEKPVAGETPQLAIDDKPVEEVAFSSEIFAEADDRLSPAAPPPKRKTSALKLVAAPRKLPPLPPDAPARRGRKGLKLVPAAGLEITAEDAPPTRKKGWRIVPAGDADE